MILQAHICFGCLLFRRFRPATAWRHYAASTRAQIDGNPTLTFFGGRRVSYQALPRGQRRVRQEVTGIFFSSRLAGYRSYHLF